MNTELKKYELMVARVFLATHPRKGQETRFKQKISDLDKIHTLRLNYERWKKIAEEVNAGKAVVILKEWNGKPYNSGKTILQYLSKITVQRAVVAKNDWRVVVGEEPKQIFVAKATIAINDGLNDEDFAAWFFPKQSSPDTVEAAIIQFTDFKYK